MTWMNWAWTISIHEYSGRALKGSNQWYEIFRHSFDLNIQVCKNMGFIIIRKDDRNYQMKTMSNSFTGVTNKEKPPEIGEKYWTAATLAIATEFGRLRKICYYHKYVWLFRFTWFCQRVEACQTLELIYTQNIGTKKNDQSWMPKLKQNLRTHSKRKQI